MTDSIVLRVGRGVLTLPFVFASASMSFAGPFMILDSVVDRRPGRGVMDVLRGLDGQHGGVSWPGEV